MMSTAVHPRFGGARDVLVRGAGHDHVVQFYESEEFLYGLVVGLVGAGLRAGQPVIAVATRRHGEIVSARLASLGIDVEGARRSGQLELLDAGETLATILVDGTPDWDAFQRVVGSTLRRAASGPFTGRVRVYGEMVDLLWKDGNGRAAVELERMWNRLAVQHSFSLLCTYEMGHFAEDPRATGVDEICGSHDYVVPGESWADAGDADARLRQVVALQARACALERELQRRRELELALRAALAERRNVEEERRRLEDQLRRQNEDLARSVRLTEMFVGMLGHDLRNPLNAIATAASLLGRRAETDRISQPAMRIARSAVRMARMIDQMLDVTRIRLGRGIPLHRRPSDLAEVCRLAIDELEGDAAAPRVVLEAAGDLLGSWDPDRLARLVSNLVGNALHHGRPGGRVQVRLDGESRAEVVLAVSNAGAIPADVLPTVFEPFGGARGRDPTSGLGLGLHISREVAVAHGGTIEVVSTEEEGTTFTVRLPREAPIARA